jgi:hypothetical protein
MDRASVETESSIRDSMFMLESNRHRLDSGRIKPFIIRWDELLQWMFNN